MAITESGNVLLTGAGFTKNFGGFLASDFQSYLFNDSRIKTVPRIREELRADADFESLYQRVLDGDYSADEKKALREAVLSIYGKLDARIRRIGFESDAPRPVGRRYSKLLDEFLGKKDVAGYVFTLNQDLFLERSYWDHGGPIPLLPGITPHDSWFTTRFTEPLSEAQPATLPTESELDALKAAFPSPGRSYYVKLHGSCNWVSHAGDDRMIIGGQKTERISQVPILKWYFEIFQRVVSRPDSRLLIIGYGFGDGHINRIIADCVSESGLKLYVLGPGSLGWLSEHVQQCESGDILLFGLDGHFPYTLAEVFPPEDGPPTQQWLDIMEAAFGLEIDQRYR